MSVTEVLVVGGQRFRVEGTAEEVESKILDAARGSILELVWLVESGPGRSVALNPAHIVAVGEAQPHQDQAPD